MNIEQMMVEEYAVRRVRQLWAFARDHAEWETMRSCFHPDASVSVLWYSGPVSGFLERTIAMATKRKPGEASKHWLGNSRVWVKGNRAILETDTMVMNRDHIDDHLVDFTIHLRLYDRLERRGTGWKIARMNVIYDKDRIEPVIPGAIPTSFFDGVKLGGPDAAVAMARWRIERRGGMIPPDMTLGGTESEKTLRAEAEAWLDVV
jgi:hypothetical protein